MLNATVHTDILLIQKPFIAHSHVSLLSLTALHLVVIVIFVTGIIRLGESSFVVHIQCHVGFNDPTVRMFGQ